MPARRLRAKTERKFAKKKKPFFVIEDRRSYFSFFEGDNSPSLFFRLPRAQTTKSPLSFIFFFFSGKVTLNEKKEDTVWIFRCFPPPHRAHTGQARYREKLLLLSL